MSVDINTKYLSGKLFISQATIDKYRSMDARLSKQAFVVYDDALGPPEESGFRAIERPSWGGVGGSSTMSTYAEILSETVGEADILVNSNGSPDYGIRVRHGVVTYHKLTVALGEEIDV